MNSEARLLNSGMNFIAEYLIKFESKQDRRLYCNPCHETLNTRARVGLRNVVDLEQLKVA